MTRHQLVISPQAKVDLREIYPYGRRHWGQVQSDRYLTSLKNLLWSVTEQPQLGVERSDLLPNLRSLPTQSHTVFYRTTNNRVEIIRILHGRQDPGRHLK